MPFVLNPSFTQVSQHERGVARFHEAVLSGILRHVDWERSKAIIIASPRFVRVRVSTIYQIGAMLRTTAGGHLTLGSQSDAMIATTSPHLNGP